MTKIFKLSPVIFLLLLLSHFFASTTEILAQDKASKIDKFMTKIVENRQFNGSVLVAVDGEIIYKKGFGYANMDWEIPNKPDTKFVTQGRVPMMKCEACGASSSIRSVG